MTAGAAILLNEVATLGGGAPTLEGTATPTLGGGVTVAGKSGGAGHDGSELADGVEVFQLLIGIFWDSLPKLSDEIGISEDGFILL
jgi:hypothetical protein